VATGFYNSRLQLRPRLTGRTAAVWPEPIITSTTEAAVVAPLIPVAESPGLPIGTHGGLAHSGCILLISASAPNGGAGINSVFMSLRVTAIVHVRLGSASSASFRKAST
jgi:hypothetical protein